MPKIIGKQKRLVAFIAKATSLHFKFTESCDTVIAKGSIEMSRCTLDHTQSDVLQKLTEQQAFLPDELVKRCELFLSKPLDQETLNEVFHLLKKYDLSEETERMKRNQMLVQLFG